MHLRRNDRALLIRGHRLWFGRAGAVGLFRRRTPRAGPGCLAFLSRRARSEETSNPASDRQGKMPPVAPGSQPGEGRSRRTEPRRRPDPIDARFGTNEVERQLRVALRTAQEG